MRSRWLLPALALCLPACADETTRVAADDTGTDGSDDGTEGDDDDESTTATTEVAESSSTTAPPVEFVPIPARGIVLTDVEANQGVGVPILREGEWVQGSARNAELVRGRDMLVRAFWAIEPDFEARDIEARLELRMPDGTIEVAKKTVHVAGPSDPSDLDLGFWWGVPADLLVGGLEYQITLWETDFGYEGTPEPSPAPAFPASFEQVGLETSDLALRVLLVPVHHNLGTQCADPPVVDELAIQIFRDALYKQNPVQEVVITAHPGIEWTGDLNSFIPLLGTLSNLHADVDPGVYVYGIVRPCDGGPQDVGGQAIDIPGFPSTGNSWSRTAVGRFYSNLSQTAETFVHEIGHTQGRMHVYCNGMEGGPTPLYPYEGGIIGVWGFDIVEFNQLHKPDVAKDYMTYCGNAWVSDWGWHQVFPYIEEITSWDAGDAPAPDTDGELLVGLVDPATGDETWFATRGSIGTRAPAFTEAVEIVDEHGTVHEITATLGSLGEGGAYNLAIAVPAGAEPKRALGLTRISAGVRRQLVLAN